MYAERDTQGRIVRISAEPGEGCDEFVAAGSSELQDFLGREADTEQARLRQSDLDFVRVLEDVIGVLIDKGVIRYTDLPPAAQDKLSQRQSLRSRVNSLSLLGDDADDGVI